MTILIYGYTLLFLAGIGVLFLAYLFYRRWTKGKIICYFYTKDRGIYRRSIRPDDLGTLKHKGRAYVFKQDKVLMTKGFLLREPTPALFFSESEVHPIDLFKKTPDRGEGGISSTELSSMLNDATVRDFISAQGKYTVSQVMYTQLLGFALLLIAVAAAAYFIIGNFGNQEPPAL